jgi:hypothetical protein
MIQICSVNNECMNAVQLCTHYLHYMSSKIDWHLIMYLCVVCAQESIADLDKWLIDTSIDITKCADGEDAWCYSHVYMIYGLEHYFMYLICLYTAVDLWHWVRPCWPICWCDTALEQTMNDGYVSNASFITWCHDASHLTRRTPSQPGINMEHHHSSLPLHCTEIWDLSLRLPRAWVEHTLTVYMTWGMWLSPQHTTTLVTEIWLYIYACMWTSPCIDMLILYLACNLQWLLNI